MRLPIRCESLPSQRLRYGRAIDHIHDVRAMARGKQPVPSGERDHVFDFLDGFRLVVSRDRSELGIVQIHGSASVDPGSHLYQSVRDGSLSPSEFLALAMETYRALSRDAREPCVALYSRGKGIPHWFIDDDQVATEEPR